MDPLALVVSLLGIVTGAGWVGAAVLVAKGKLYPASTVDRIRADAEKALTELRDQWTARLAESFQREQAWRTAYERSEAAREIAARQIDTLMDYAKTTDAVLRALPGGRSVA